jgi:hypothetical protein
MILWNMKCHVSILERDRSFLQKYLEYRLPAISFCIMLRGVFLGLYKSYPNIYICIKISRNKHAAFMYSFTVTHILAETCDAA